MHLRTQAMCALVTAGLLVGFSTMTNADPLKVKTEQGKVVGKAINNGKVRAYMGLPYAAPPVADLRWKAPQPPAKWKGERDATKYGAHCAQGRVFDDMAVVTPAAAVQSRAITAIFFPPKASSS